MKNARDRWRRFGRILLGVLVVFALIALGFTVAGWRAFGHCAVGEVTLRMHASHQWSEKDDRFVDPQPIVNDNGRILGDMFHSHPNTTPNPPLTPAPIDPQRFAAPPASGLRVTWMGHSTSLVEVDGLRVLTDPVWSDRASPYTSIGPKRWYPPLIALADLPPIDVVVVSHDHYDHLDESTIEVLATTTKALFLVPLGLGGHLSYWGVPKNRIVELDWWELAHVGKVTFTLTPARHASGRFLLDRDATLWGGFAITGPKHRVYVAGDSGFFPALKDIGAKLGPFDVALIEVGQYDQAWPDWHMGPERAVEASTLVRARMLLPVHWALFEEAHHAWTEPVERTLAAAAKRNVTVATPRPGESVEPSEPLTTTRWWPNVPWKTAEEAPLVTSGVMPEP